jgi:hypothetical protein
MSRVAPFHAATAIYSEGDFIYLHLRATKGYTQELSFPATPGGMAALMRVLREREMAGATQPHRIAGPTMPIQHVVNSWARDPNAEAKAERARERAERERFARKPLTEKLKDMEELFNDPNFEF